LKTTSKSRLIFILKIAVTIAVYAFVIHKIAGFGQWQNIYALIKTALFPFLIILLLTPINWLSEAVLWQHILKPVRTINKGFALKTVLGGTIPALITPARVGEWPGRAMFFDSNIRSSVATAAAYSGVIKTLSVTLLGLASFVVILFFFDPILIAGLNNIALLTSVAGLVLLLMVLFSNQLFAIIGKFSPAIKKIPTHGKYYRINGVLLASVRIIIISTQFFLLLNILTPEPISLFDVLLIPVYFMVCTFMPVIAIAEPAMRGAAAYIVFMAGSVSTETAALAGITLWLINNVPAILTGTVYWLKMNGGKVVSR
jgi:hypothetical protein